MYYSATLFSLVGFKKATAVSIVVGGTNFIFTLVNMLFIDRLGRRKILLITVMGMALSMVVAAVAFHWIPISRDLVLESDSVVITLPGTSQCVGSVRTLCRISVPLSHQVLPLVQSKLAA